MKKSGIPAIPPLPDPGLYNVLLALKSNVEQISTPITPLSHTASMTEIITKINEVIDRMGST